MTRDEIERELAEAEAAVALASEHEARQRLLLAVLEHTVSEGTLERASAVIYGIEKSLREHTEDLDRLRLEKAAAIEAEKHKAAGLIFVKNVGDVRVLDFKMAHYFRLTAWSYRVIAQTRAATADEALLALSAGFGCNLLRFCPSGQAQYWLEALAENGSEVREEWDVCVAPRGST